MAAEYFLNTNRLAHIPAPLHARLKAQKQSETKQCLKFGRPHFSSSYLELSSSHLKLSLSSFLGPAPTATWLRDGEPKACDQESEPIWHTNSFKNLATNPCRFTNSKAWKLPYLNGKSQIKTGKIISTTANGRTTYHDLWSFDFACCKGSVWGTITPCNGT